MIVPGTTKREVGGDVGEPAQALRGARPARDHREQHQRQHERRHQQLRAAELHAQRAPPEREHDAALARGAHAAASAAPAPSSCEPVTATKTSSSVGDSTSTDSTRRRARRARGSTGAIAPLPAAVRSTTRVGAPGSAGSTLPRPASASRARPALSAVGELDVQRRLADARLERVRRALGDEPARGDDADAVGELLGLLEVLGGQEDGRALVVERAHLAPQRGAARRVQAGGRLVEEQHVRPVHEREREVQPPAHAARVAADAPVGGLRRGRRASSSATARSRAAGPRSPCSAPCMRSSSRPVISGSIAASCSATPIERRTASASRDDVVARDARGAGRRAQQRGEDADRRSSCRRRWARGSRRSRPRRPRGRARRRRGCRP